MAKIFLIIWLSALAACFIALLICEFMFRKNVNTWRNQMLILNAINAYRIYCIWHRLERTVDLSDMEDYNKTYRRIWDWGCTRILPKEKFEIVKPYIGAPKCFGEKEVTYPSSRAENGCSDCPFEAKCNSIDMKRRILENK